MDAKLLRQGGVSMAAEEKRFDELSDDHYDDHVDEEIRKCFSPENPKCFFVFAGAGSGKTRSLINTLTYIEEKMGKQLSETSRKVAVITYTNAAVDEISRRMHYSSFIAVSTIHSFLWDLIKNFQSDIREWVSKDLKVKIKDIEDKLSKSRTAKSTEKKEEEIKHKQERLVKLSTVKSFLYNPNGDNSGYNSLNHDEVIKMGCEFIENEITMQKILVSQYPIVLVDESQDTKKELVDALNAVINNNKGEFIVGMFGDTMQRIYLDGKENLSDSISDEWVKPVKVMNHRSAVRIVQLANSIRSSVDGQQQKPRSDAMDGVVRLFIVDSSADKDATEKKVAECMAQATGDYEWKEESKYKSLILEHHMAANRFGFLDLFAPLNDSKCFDTSLRNGTISELTFLSNVISPLVKAYKKGNDFEISSIVRQNSPLLEKSILATQANQVVALQEVEKAVNSLMSLWKGNKIPTCIEILESVHNTGLFKLDTRVDEILSKPADDDSKKISALREALSVPFDTLERYSDYVTDKTRFATHQGVKGLEFPRVMVVMDDAEAKGFLFSYEKLFGAKPKSDIDIKNENEGKDNSISRTARLFYVTCTRARESLAIVAYTSDVAAVKSTALSQGWFLNEEIITF